MRTLQKRAGHQDLRSTMVYLTVFDGDELDAGGRARLRGSVGDNMANEARRDRPG